MNRVLQIAISVVVVAIVAAASFTGGMLYGKGQAQTSVAGAGQGGNLPAGQAGPGMGQGTGAQAGMMSGEIQTISDGVLTIKDSSGKKIQVRVTDTTLIQKQASVTIAELVEGESVVISASQGSDGVYTARSLQVIPSGQFAGLPGSETPTTGQGTGPGGMQPGGPGMGGVIQPPGGQGAVPGGRNP